MGKNNHSHDVHHDGFDVSRSGRKTLSCCAGSAATWRVPSYSLERKGNLMQEIPVNKHTYSFFVPEKRWTIWMRMGFPYIFHIIFHISFLRFFNDILDFSSQVLLKGQFPSCFGGQLTFKTLLATWVLYTVYTHCCGMLLSQLPSGKWVGIP